MWKHNTDPTFWKQTRENCNCGSFALNLTEWFSPCDDYDDRKDFITDLLAGLANPVGEDLFEAENEILDQDELYMLSHFPQLIPLTIRDISELDAIDDCYPIIAYRIGIDCNADGVMEESDFDEDFHFKVRINGEWWEKNGSGEIHQCALDAHKSWPLPEDDNLVYDSAIRFFYMQKERKKI